MQNTSLNTLAWQKLKQNKLAFSALIFIVFCVFIGIFAVMLSPDDSPMANQMHIELATKKPLTKITFLEIPKQEINEIPFFEGLFFGKPSKVKRIPIEKYTIKEIGDYIENVNMEDPNKIIDIITYLESIQKIGIEECTKGVKDEDWISCEETKIDKYYLILNII